MSDTKRRCSPKRKKAHQKKERWKTLGSSRSRHLKNSSDFRLKRCEAIITFLHAQMTTVSVLSLMSILPLNCCDFLWLCITKWSRRSQNACTGIVETATCHQNRQPGIPSAACRYICEYVYLFSVYGEHPMHRFDGSWWGGEVGEVIPTAAL